jgi:hypothetical protein
MRSTAQFEFSESHVTTPKSGFLSATEQSLGKDQRSAADFGFMTFFP